jgi:hypothetical protein
MHQIYADSGLGKDDGWTNNSAVDRFSTISLVIIHSVTSLREGNSYITSNINSSTIPRKARAPVLRR